MKTKVAINGFGRIGRISFRIAAKRKDLEVVGVNDLADIENLAYLLKHDSNYGLFDGEIDFDSTGIIVDGVSIPVFSEKDPSLLPWSELGVDVVIESSGHFTEIDKAELHIKAGAKKVVISALGKGDGIDTIVLGVNEDKLPSAGNIISNASCTTNSIAAIMDILDNKFGVEKAMLTTVHSDTASQTLTDSPAKNRREGRSASQNIVPTTTGAATAVALAVPSLEGKFDGVSVRVPTPVVSLSDVTLLLKKDTTKKEINKVLKSASEDPFYQGIVGYSEEELVSSDYIGNSFSGIVDSHLTNVVDGNLAKVVVWYDNEWGYSNRLVELVADVGKQIPNDSNSHRNEEAKSSA